MGNLSGLDDPSSRAIILESSASGEGSVNVNSNKPSFRTSISSEPFCQTYLSYLSERKKLGCLHGINGQSKTRGSFFGEISHPTKKIPISEKSGDKKFPKIPNPRI